MKPELTIIIPLFNSEKTILESIESIEKEKINLNYEVIIVDDCSTDNSFEIVENKIKNYDNYKLLKNKKNLGGGATRNNAIKNSKSDIIYCLDSDNMIGEGSIEKMFKLLKNKNVDGVTVEKSKRFIDSLNNGHEDYYFNDYGGKTIPFESIFSLEWCPLNITFMHTKRAFEITGGYPENHGFDTQHFAVRFLSNNLKALVCHSAFDYHRIHSNQNNYYHREYLSGKSNYNWIKIFSENIHFFNEETFRKLLEFNFYLNKNSVLNEIFYLKNLRKEYKNHIVENSRESYYQSIIVNDNLSSKDLFFLLHYEKENLKKIKYLLMLFEKHSNSLYLKKSLDDILLQFNVDVNLIRVSDFKKISFLDRILNKLKFA